MTSEKKIGSNFSSHELVSINSFDRPLVVLFAIFDLVNVVRSKNIEQTKNFRHHNQYQNMHRKTNVDVPSSYTMFHLLSSFEGRVNACVY